MLWHRQNIDMPLNGLRLRSKAFLPSDEYYIISTSRSDLNIFRGIKTYQIIHLYNKVYNLVSLYAHMLHYLKSLMENCFSFSKSRI